VINACVTHQCVADGCARQIARDEFMCIDHWKMVPRALQRDVWRGWRNYEYLRTHGGLTFEDVKRVRALQAPAIAAVREKEIKRQVRRDAAGDVLDLPQPENE
jgi:hypothetical protein